jgi:FtsZ-interacting cell division protein YlmF
LYKLVDCINLKVNEGFPVREVSNIESSIEDTTEVQYEQVRESEKEYFELDEDTNTQADSNQQTTSNPSSRITQKNNPASQIIGEKDKGVQTRRRIINDIEQSHIAFISMVEPKNFNEASKYVNWVKSMNEKLDQIEKNNTWELVPRPVDKNVIGSKWVFKKKMNE